MTIDVAKSVRKMFVDGKWVDSESGEYFEADSPATGEVIAQVPKGTRADAQRAVEAAHRARGALVPGTRLWTPGEDELVRTLPRGEAARRTGRTFQAALLKWPLKFRPRLWVSVAFMAIWRMPSMRGIPIATRVALLR